MGMEMLGRTINVVPQASAVGLRCDTGTGWTFVVWGTATTYTLTSSATFGGSYTSPGPIIVRTYNTSTATNGTAAWARVNQTAANTVVNAGTGAIAFYVDNASLRDGDKYIKLTAGSGTNVVAIQGDLSVQRTPANLPILSA